jgi:hypothetical protein
MELLLARKILELDVLELEQILRDIKHENSSAYDILQEKVEDV